MKLNVSATFVLLRKLVQIWFFIVLKSRND